MFAVALLSLIPVDLRRRWRAVALYYPVLILPLAFMYETGIRAEIHLESVPVPIDLLVLRPLLAFVVLAGASRWILVLALKYGEAPRADKTGRPAQVIAVLLWAVVCLARFAMNWG